MEVISGIVAILSIPIVLPLFLIYLGIEAVWRRWFGPKEKPQGQPLPATCECGERFKMELTATGRNWVLICPTHGAVKIRRVEN